MKTFAFLRAINVGGHRVTMDELRGIFLDLELSRVETFLASGNVVFDADGGGADAGLERRIEEALASSLGYEVATFLRTPAELASTVAAGVVGPDRLAAATAASVAFLKRPLGADDRSKLGTLTTDVDAFEVDGREVFWLCAVRQSDSKFSNAVFERTLGMSATFRGMNTVRRLASKYLDDD